MHTDAHGYTRQFCGLEWGVRSAERAYTQVLNLSIEIEREEDGRWLAEALELPGVMAYGRTPEEAISETERVAIEVIADRIAHGELSPSALNLSFSIPSEHLARE